MLLTGFETELTSKYFRIIAGDLESQIDFGSFTIQDFDIVYSVEDYPIIQLSSLSIAELNIDSNKITGNGELIRFANSNFHATVSSGQITGNTVSSNGKLISCHNCKGIRGISLETS